MKVIVIGSGLIGVTTAYYLSRAGHHVTVIDRDDGPGRDTSFANGALLTPSMAEPWNTPGCWRVLLASIGRSDSALQLRLRTLPSLAGWGIRFLRNSNAATFRRSASANLQLALQSLRTMESLRQQTNIEYGRAARGSLKIFRSAAAQEKATAVAEAHSADGLRSRRLNRSETVELEPALAPIAEELAGAIHYESDEVGDAYQFCVGLADLLRRQGVEFRFSTEVRSLQVRAGEVTAVVGDKESFVADRYIVAAGSYSTPLLKSIGVDLPVQPVKGYSVTFDAHRGAPPLRIPLIDDSWHAAIVPVGDAIRVAGTAEFAGYDRTLDRKRADNLIRLVRQVLPEQTFDPVEARPWCALRPMSADGVPIIGTTPLSNLMVNTGHGHLGWTLAAGSAQLLCDVMSGGKSAVDPALYSLERFAS